MNTILDIQNVEEEYEIEGQYHEHTFHTTGCKIVVEGK